MAGKLIWRVPQWRGVAWERERPEWQARFGPAVAELIVRFRLVASDADGPARVDQVRTLQAFVRAPESVTPAELANLDPDTDDRLTVQAWRLFRRQHVELLPPAELARCAAAALAELPTGRGGRPRTQELVVPFLASVLEALPNRPRGAALHALVGDVLTAAGAIGRRRRGGDAAINDNVRRLLCQAGRLRRGRVS